MALKDDYIKNLELEGTDVELSDFLLSEEEKENEEYLIRKTDRVIENNVRENSQKRKIMFKMRDFYDGHRDPQEYAYLENNYGIGNPAEIKFTPLIRNRIDILIGLLSATEFDYKVSITDSKTLFKLEQDKANQLIQSLYDLIGQEAQKQEEQEQNVQPLTPAERLIEQAEDQLNRNWRNVFQEAAIDFIEDCRACPVINVERLRELLFEDITVVGEGIYRVYSHEEGLKPVPEALLPENCYYTLRRDKSNINESSEFVYLRYMSKQDVLMRYGHLMSKDEKMEVLKLDTVPLSEVMYHYGPLGSQDSDEGDEERRRSSVDRYNRFGEDKDVLRIYEVEWKANNEYDIDPEDVKARRVVSGPDNIQKKRNRQDLYRSVRINDSVYLDMGKVENATRYDSDPDKVHLTFNGARFSDRGGAPYSVLWKCKDIQDKHDILLFHRDNLIASSGVRGVNLEYSKIPDFYGDDEMERVMKALAMLKQGVNVTDGTQEGSELPSGAHGTFDMTVNGESLNALNNTIAQLDNEATQITGVTPAMMGAIEQREAVANVKQGINQTSLTLKKLYDTHDRIMKFLLTDLINTFQSTMGDEYKGTYQEGNKVFTIIKENFSFTNYRLKVVNTSQEARKVEEAKAIVQSAMSTGSVPWDIGMRVVMMDNPAEMLKLASEIAEKQNNLAKQLQEANSQLEELQKQLEQAQQQLEAANSEKSELEKQKVAIQQKLADAKIAIDAKEQSRKVVLDETNRDLKERQLTLEEKQLHLSEDTQKREVRNDIV